MKRPAKPIVITAELLEQCLDRVALVIHRAGANGPTYLPIYNRLEEELAALKAREATMAAVHARLSRLRDRTELRSS